MIKELDIDPWHYAHCYNHFPIIRTFPERFLSYEEHLLKPEEKFYRVVAERLAVKPDQCLFIDDLKENVVAAENVGYQTILFKNAEDLQTELKKLGVRYSI